MGASSSQALALERLLEGAGVGVGVGAGREPSRSKSAMLAAPGARLYRARDLPPPGPAASVVPTGLPALDRCARAHAWLRGADYVSPEDVQAVAKDVLRHRILLTFEAEANGLTPDAFLDRLIARVPVA